MEDEEALRKRLSDTLTVTTPDASPQTVRAIALRGGGDVTVDQKKWLGSLYRPWMSFNQAGAVIEAVCRAGSRRRVPETAVRAIVRGEEWSPPGMCNYTRSM